MADEMSNAIQPAVVEPDVTDITEVPVLPLRDVVVYPHMVIPLFVGRLRSTLALEAAVQSGKKILLVAQKKASENEPQAEDLYEYGTLANILQLLKLPDGTIKVLVEGIERARVTNYLAEPDYLKAKIEMVSVSIDEGRDVEILMRTALSQFEKYIKINQKIPPEVMATLSNIEDPSRLADTIASHLPLKIDIKQQLLEAEDLVKRYELLHVKIAQELDIIEVAEQVKTRVRKQMEENHRAYYLREQMEAIQKELGDIGETGNENDELEKKIRAAGMTKEAEEKALSELSRLRKMPPTSAEAIVSQNFIDWLVKVPWKAKTKITYNLRKAKEILDEEHYGLETVKDRIIEFLAVQQRVPEPKGQILCLVGPPGVGKTSLGQSIAKATGRKFVRVSLGGIRDEAEIRGHRRTYIGSMPGKVIQKLAKVGVRNPLFQLDEVDKMAMDFRGDPASALLEVLDPEQNNTFNDHYLEVDYDLSEVMFITTANTLNIPAPLLDRMEVIRLPGYTESEKMNIAKNYFLDKQIRLNGLKPSEIKICDSAINDIIRYYTREAGVRNLERDIAKICRKVLKEILLTIKKSKQKISLPVVITSRNLEKYLGVQKFRYGLADARDQIGQVNGLAWTEVGGDLLTIEAAVVPGHNKAIYTGHLGEVMTESIQAAMTVVRSRAPRLGIKKNFFEKHDIHVHVPEGATPKDGPSAGISMCTALVSVITGIPVKRDVAMTGEITLRGEVLPIGGLKEKLLAAHRGGIKMVLIPEENRRDLKEIPANIKKDLEIKPVRWIDEVLALALTKSPLPLTDEEMARDNLTAAELKKLKKLEEKDELPPHH
jgi:ATP-dependent Lon protease